MKKRNNYLLLFAILILFVYNRTIYAVTATGGVKPVLGEVRIGKGKEDLDKSVKEKQPDGNAWYKTQDGLWYYFESDGVTRKRGWFNDYRDDQTYYLFPETGVMAVGLDIDRWCLVLF